jgi:hypothetical protein
LQTGSARGCGHDACCELNDIFLSGRCQASFAHNKQIKASNVPTTTIWAA